MSWQIFVVISIVTNAFSNVIQRVVSKEEKSDPYVYAVIYQLGTALLVGLVVVMKGFHTFAIVPVLPAFLLMTICYSVANILLFKSLQRIEASEFTIIFSSRVWFGILGAVFFLHEVFLFREIIGTLEIVISILLVSWKKQSIRMGRGEIYAFVAAIGFGFGFVIDAFILRTVDALFFTFLNFLLPGLFLIVCNPKAVGKIKSYVTVQTSIRLIVLCLLSAVTGCGLFIAYHLGRNAAQISSLYQTSTILTVLLAVVVLHERTRIPYKIAASVLCVIGIVLLSN